MHSLRTDHTQVNKRGGPAYTVLARADTDRERWQRLRRDLITASEVPYVLGMYGPGARMRYWYEKAGLIERESGDDFEGAQMGHRLEPFHAELFGEKAGRSVRREQKLLRSRRYPWLGATLDYTQRIGRGPGVPLELKSSGAKHNWPEDEREIRYSEIEFVGEPSLRYQAQLQTQLLVYGADWGTLSALLGSPYMHHRWRDFELHPRFSQMILERTHAFHESLRTGRPPDPDDSELTLRTLKDATVHSEPITRRLPEEALGWSAELDAARAAALEAQRKIRYFESVLLIAMGNAERGELPDGSAYVIQRTNRKGYTVPPTVAVSLKKEEP